MNSASPRSATVTWDLIRTGLVAWQWKLDGQRLKEHPIHAFGARLSIEPVDLDSVGHPQEDTAQKEYGVLSRYRLPIEAAPVAVVTVTGRLGSFLSRLNGPAQHLQDCQSDWIGKNGNLVILRPVF